MQRASAHDRLRHRAWTIRACATGMGTGPVALVMFPIYLVTGEPPMGLASDIVVVGMWLLTITVGEWVIRSMAPRTEPRNFPHPRDPQPLTILWRHAGQVAKVERNTSRRSRST
jgi:hypothetical protein